MSAITEKRFARWIDYGQHRFSFSHCRDCYDANDGVETVFMVSDRNGASAYYVSGIGGFNRIGFVLGSEPLQLQHIRANLFDRLQIESELLPE